MIPYATGDNANYWPFVIIIAVCAALIAAAFILRPKK